MQRNLVFVVMALLAVFGIGMVLSFTAGGFMFGLCCFAAALALWLLHRGVMALELSADLLAQSLLQRNKVPRNHADAENRPEATVRGSEVVREDSQPVAAGD